MSTKDKVGIIKAILRSVVNAFYKSKKSIHIVTIIIAIILVAVILVFDVEISNENMISMLNGIAILSSFFIFSIQGIDFKYINKKYSSNNEIRKNIITGKRTPITQADVMRCTIYSITIIVFSLVALCFMFNFFGINIKWILVVTMTYLFVGIIFTIVVWNFTNSIKKDD